jgi:hypothetical protein
MVAGGGGGGISARGSFGWRRDHTGEHQGCEGYLWVALVGVGGGRRWDGGGGSGRGGDGDCGSGEVVAGAAEWQLGEVEWKVGNPLRRLV